MQPTSNNVNTWNPDSANITEVFIEQLDEAVSGRRELTVGDQDMRYALGLQQARLRKKGLILTYSLTPRGFKPGGNQLKRTWQDLHYISKQTYYTCLWERRLLQGNRVLYRNKTNMTLYETYTDVVEGTDVREDIYVCPNCGAPTKIAELLNGCSYCGSKFQISELYPNISNYYMVMDMSMEKKEAFKKLGIFMPAAAGVTFVMAAGMGLIQGELFHHGLIKLIGYAVASVFMGAPMGYFAFSFYLLGKLFGQAGRTMPMMGAIGSAKKFENYVKNLSPEFSYEYFTGKVLSMLRMILFAENPQNVPYYIGEPLDERFRDMVDLQFRGAVTYIDMKVEGSMMHVQVDVFLNNMYAAEERVSNIDERLRVSVVKNMNVPIKYHFSVRKLECPNCGRSFDATRSATCPYCNSTYRIENLDWAIESIKKV